MISINATMIVQIINLLVLIFILNRIMYRPIRKITAQREEKLSQDKIKVEELNEDNLVKEQAYFEDLKKGRVEVRTKMIEAKDSTEQEALAVIQKAHDKAKEQEIEIRRRIEEQVQQARKEISKEAQNVAIKMAGVILGREVS